MLPILWFEPLGMLKNPVKHCRAIFPVLNGVKASLPTSGGTKSWMVHSSWGIEKFKSHWVDQAETVPFEFGHSPLCQKVRTVALDVQPSRLVAARRQQSQTQGTSKTHSSGTWPGRFLQQPEIETRENREFKSIYFEHNVHIKIVEKLNSKGIPLYCTC